MLSHIMRHGCLLSDSIVSSSYFSTNQEGETALIKAALADEASVVTLLLDAKANVDHADNVRFA
jgi:ankyrin repeat protein